MKEYEKEYCMKQTMKRYTAYMIVFAIFSCSIMVRFTQVEALDFEGNEDYWTKYCSGIISEQSKIDECNQYASYIQNKINDSDAAADRLSSDIGEVKEDLSNLEEISKGYLAKITSTQTSIDTINASIAQMEANIIQLDDDIAQTTLDIEARKNVIKERMVNLQVSVNTNEYLDFVMGAEDLVDLIRKTSSIDLFTKNDKEQLRLLDEDMSKLAVQKENQIQLKATTEIQKTNLEITKSGLEQLKADNDAMAIELEAQIALLNKSLNEQETASATLANLSPHFAIDNGSANVGDLESKGLIDPIQNSWISRGVSTGHRGVDYAATMGTPIVAPADCYIVFACTGFANGWLGNMDGPSKGAPFGGGNSVRIIFNVEGVSYAMNFHHLESVPSIIMNAVGKNVVITQGSVIGYVGSSGNSTGPHAHVEMFLLHGSIQEAVATWYTTGDWQSSAGWGLYTPASGSYGTRVDPQAYF